MHQKFRFVSVEIQAYHCSEGKYRQGGNDIIKWQHADICLRNQCRQVGREKVRAGEPGAGLCSGEFDATICTGAGR
jgi:hypothetical protein